VRERVGLKGRAEGACRCVHRPRGEHGDQRPARTGIGWSPRAARCSCATCQDAAAEASV